MSETSLDLQATSFRMRDVRPRTAILPLAALEQHGPHLPVATDWIVVDEIARRVAAELPSSYLLPTLPFGTSIAHAGTMGTVGLSWPTLMHVITDLVQGLLDQDIHRVAVINNLGEATGTTVVPRGNFIAKTAVRQLNYDHPELEAAVDPGDPHQCEHRRELAETGPGQVPGHLVGGLGDQHDHGQIVEELERADGALARLLAVRAGRLPQGVA